MYRFDWISHDVNPIDCIMPPPTPRHLNSNQVYWNLQIDFFWIGTSSLRCRINVQIIVTVPREKKNCFLPKLGMKRTTNNGFIFFTFSSCLLWRLIGLWALKSKASTKFSLRFAHNIGRQLICLYSYAIFRKRSTVRDSSAISVECNDEK